MYGLLRSRMIVGLLAGAALALLTACPPPTGPDFEQGDPGDITPREADFRPLPPTRFITVNRQVEYLILGGDYDGTDKNRFIVDPYEPGEADAQGYARPVAVAADADVLHSAQDSSLLTTRRKVARAGQLDNDYHDEVAVVSWAATGAGTLAVVDCSEAGAVDADPGADLSITSPAGDTSAWEHRYDLAMADVDGDGYDEIVVAGTAADPSDVAIPVGVVWIFDDAEGGYALLGTVSLVGAFDPGGVGYQGIELLHVDAGNLDDDRAAEIVAAYAYAADAGSADGVIYFVIIDDAGAESATSDELTTETALASRTIAAGVEDFFDLSLGDVDRDGLAEIVIGTHYAVSGGGTFLDVEVIDDVAAGLATFEIAFTEHFGTVSAGCAPIVMTVDIDGDKAAEVLLGDRLFEDLYTKEFEPVQAGGVNLTPADLGLESAVAVAVGDVDGDFRQDIMSVSSDVRLKAVGFHEDVSYDTLTGEQQIEIVWRQKDARGDQTTTFTSVALASVNCDDDSIVVEYNGDDPDLPAIEIDEAHTVYYSRNHLIAVLAAPPCAERIGQNLDGCSTGFGTGAATAFTTGMEVAARAGVLVGASVEVQAGFISSTTVFSFEMEMETSIEIAASMSTTTEVSKRVTSYAAWNEDLVVFSTVPYDRYTYTISSHPDPNLVGKSFHLDIPQEPKILSMTREYYNEHNGDQMDIDEQILSSTPGDLASYPSAADKADILAERTVATGMGFTLLSLATSLGEVGPETVSQGEGSKEVELELSRTYTAGTSITLSMDFMAKACVTGVCAGVTAGFSIGGFFEAETTTSTTFIGSVGAIDSAHYADEAYDFGLFAYRQTLADDESLVAHDFFVVNYWVE